MPDNFTAVLPLIPIIMSEAWRAVSPLEQVMLEEYVPHKPDIITVVFTLRTSIPESFVHSVILPRLLSHPRFSARLVASRRGVFRFEPVPAPSLSSHVTEEAAIPADEPRKEQHRLFTDRLSEIVSTPLDLSAPPWRIHLFRGWSVSRGSCEAATLVLRVHHSLSDGIGLVKYFLARVADSDMNDNPVRLLVPSRRSKGTAEERPRCVARVRELVDDVTRIFVKPLWRDPVSVLTTADMTESSLCALATPEEITVPALKQATKKLGVTINDLLFAAFAGAIRAYLTAVGDDPDALRGLRVAMPFNKHVFSEFSMDDVSNQLLMIPVPLPAHVAGRAERLFACAEAMKKLKRSFQPLFAGLAMRQLVRLPKGLRRRAWHTVGSSASALFSNVAGPTETMRIGEFPVDEVYFFPPPDAHVACDVGIFSYAGRVFIGAAGDANRLSQPQKLLDFIIEEVQGMFELSQSVAENVGG